MKYPIITTLGNIRNADNASLRECMGDCMRLYHKSGNVDYKLCANRCMREIKRRERSYSDLIDQ